MNMLDLVDWFDSRPVWMAPLSARLQIPRSDRHLFAFINEIKTEKRTKKNMGKEPYLLAGQVNPERNDQSYSSRTEIF